MIKRGRYKELDSLRGLAAITVVFHHCLLTFPIFFAAYLHEKTVTTAYPVINIFTYTPLHIVWAGSEAVLLFFILSGFVLTLLFTTKKQGYFSYLIARICRIYLPYLFSILISLFLMKVLITHDTPNLSTWFNGMWSHKPSFKTIVGYFLMLGYETHNVNTVTWSLVHEMRISVIFPLIIWLVYKFNWKISLPLGIGCCLVLSTALTFISRFLVADTIKSFFIGSIGSTIYYCAFFIIGSTLARYKDSIGSCFSKIKVQGKLFFAVLFVFLYTFEWWMPAVGFIKQNGSIKEAIMASTMIDYVVAFGILILFIFALNSSKLSHIFTMKPLLFLGKISYSLYLIHPIILLTLMHTLIGSVPNILILIIMIVASLIAAIFMHYFIEVPSIKLGTLLKKSSLNYEETEKKAII